jgi:hypothetical protein
VPQQQQQQISHQYPIANAQTSVGGSQPMPSYSTPQRPAAHAPANGSPYADGSSPAFHNPFDDVPQPQQQARPATSANYADALKQLENMVLDFLFYLPGLSVHVSSHCARCHARVQSR